MKLIDLLVKELPKRGGWPDGVAAMAQDADGAVQNYRGTDDIRIDSQNAFGASRIIGSYSIAKDEVSAASDRLTAIITRAQYESALAASEGWIEWVGGECPVETGVLVDVRYRDGQELSALPAKSKPTGERDASRAFWHNDGNLNDIIAYRLHKPDLNSRVNDDLLEQDLNECIGQDVDMPEWSGDGLPPAGIDIEYRLTKVNYRNDFSRGRVIAYGISNVFMEHWSSKNEFIQPLDKIEFRPLRTEAEKAREAACRAISHILDEDRDFQFDAKKIYDAIAAGKIPGVKLENK